MEQDVPQLTLRDGTIVPQLGFGTRRLAAADSQRLVEAALAAGYRAFDIAPAAEAGIGRALSATILQRGALTLMATLGDTAETHDTALRAFNATMTALGIDQLDLLLLNRPASGAGSAAPLWTALGQLQQQGHVRAIGLSGFERHELERLIADTGLTPAVHRIDLHPRLQQRDHRGFHARRGIRLVSRHPLGPAGSLADPTLAAIAGKHRRSIAQIVLRWHLQEGLLLFPATARPEHLADNVALFDFALDAEDMYRIEAIDGAEDPVANAQPVA